MIVRAEEHPHLFAEHREVAEQQRAERVPRDDAWCDRGVRRR